MFTVKLMKYGPHSTHAPTPIVGISLHEVDGIHVRLEEDGRQVLQLGNAPGPTMEVTVGLDQSNCSYDVAYIMNSSGQTVDKIC